MVNKRRYSLVRDASRLRYAAAFTLIELLVVMAIVALLLTLAMPRYFQSVDNAKEVVLRENLKTVRDTIDKFHSDTGRYPNNLEELVERKYFRALPIDPITESSSTWILIAPEDEEKGAVYSIKSSAAGVSRDGVPYTNF